MASYYADSSALVKRYIAETRSNWWYPRATSESQIRYENETERQ
jgi:hypothetical protein